MGTKIQAGRSYADRLFEDVDLGKGRIEASQFHGCTFIRCSFGEACFERCRFVNCGFEECDLSLVQVPGSSFSGVRFEGSRLIGVDWTQANWEAPRLGYPLTFYSCALSHSTFIGLNLNGIVVRDCTAKNVDFREANLSEADFSGTDLAESLFSSTNLTRANLSRARNYDIAPGSNVLTKARFSLPEAMSLLFNLDIVLTDGET